MSQAHDRSSAPLYKTKVPSGRAWGKGDVGRRIIFSFFFSFSSSSLFFLFSGGLISGRMLGIGSMTRGPFSSFSPLLFLLLLALLLLLPLLLNLTSSCGSFSSFFFISFV